MELKNKKNAITLVELIIALTMVSILMVMMFGIIFKKTKSAVLTPSGVFYCWKDWNGNLHQRIFYTIGSKSEVLSSPASLDHCELDFPKIVTKDINNLKAYIIGGGAAGDKYDAILSSKEYPDCKTMEQIKNDLNCENLYDKTKSVCCVKKNNNVYSGCDDMNPESIEPTASNFNGQQAEDLLNKKRLGKCIVKVSDSNECFLFDSDKARNYFYNIEDNNRECSFGVANSECRYYPYVYNLNPHEQKFEKSNSRQKIECKGYQQIRYQITTSNAINEFKPVDVKNIFDLNKPYKIDAYDIGNPGVYNEDNSASASGTATILRSQLTGEEVERAEGVKYGELKNITSDLKYKFSELPKDNPFSTPFHFSPCCGESRVQCGIKKIDTKIGDYVGLTNPEFPKLDYSCDSLESPKRPSYGNDNDGFGLFGYSGASGYFVFNYLPYFSVTIDEGKQGMKLINNVESNPDVNPFNPLNGMGGAIIIQWN